MVFLDVVLYHLSRVVDTNTQSNCTAKRSVLRSRVCDSTCGAIEHFDFGTDDDTIAKMHETAKQLRLFDLISLFGQTL